MSDNFPADDSWLEMAFEDRVSGGMETETYFDDSIETEVDDLPPEDDANYD